MVGTDTTLTNFAGVQRLIPTSGPLICSSKIGDFMTFQQKNFANKQIEHVVDIEKKRVVPRTEALGTPLSAADDG